MIEFWCEFCLLLVFVLLLLLLSIVNIGGFFFLSIILLLGLVDDRVDIIFFDIVVFFEVVFELMLISFVNMFFDKLI